MLKKSKFLAVLMSAFFLLSFAGCSVVDQVKDSVAASGKDKTIVSKDGKFEVTVPGNWKEETNLNPEANLQVSNRLQEQYLVVIDESKQDFQADITLDEYANLVKENMKSNGEDMSTGGDKEITVNGGTGKYFEVTGTVNKIKAKYVVVITQDNDNIYQIISWSLVSKFDKNKDTLVKVAQSLKATTAK
ncbi:MAG: hypothetical protein Q8930_07040 [Bacillota bacterium]|nr:hypothetical protein [Bacillota bacterium]